MPIWIPPKMWGGGECWIVGGGPSILREFEVPPDIAHKIQKRELPLSTLSPYMSAIHKKHIIGINSAYMIGDWMDIIFFGDSGWYTTHRVRLSEYSALKVSCAPRFEKYRADHPSRIKYMMKDKKHNYGITTVKGKVSWNQNSGSAAINLAYHLGIKRVILLGFDMRKDDDDYNTHWHGYHVELISKNTKTKPRPIKSPVYEKHLRGFPKIAKEAEALGMEIINASPNSAIKSFPKKTVKELLNA